MVWELLDVNDTGFSCFVGVFSGVFVVSRAVGHDGLSFKPARIPKRQNAFFLGELK